MTTEGPTLVTERRLLGSRGRLVAGMDEVGRGSVFGPVGVGVVVTDARNAAPAGLADSKLLSATRREGLVADIEGWALGCGIGYASAGEIDTYGISVALGLAGRRGLAAAIAVAGEIDWVLLDGPFDWLVRAADALGETELPNYEVVTMVKADRTCASVAAASVLAKVARDALVVTMAESYPGYGIERHKGYGTPEHLAAITKKGASDEHRRSWNLPG